ncbi:hypothetical protein L228DRAFT_13278 [Xylona heveae TC161]|uniref:Uncharacterized protein n=1 Tax=Xylona heveae (strain CBS 132557 / TC161) TaxID=1328760 RepID=A0A165JPE8_XYLHT|nr:hypothetical protein L228DRAFT_13278 [Xylona heveae TC161]KZF26479.1 hypothetical protein L228DRAFT_13278 [Xylona heveae TC161]
MLLHFINIRLKHLAFSSLSKTHFTLFFPPSQLVVKSTFSLFFFFPYRAFLSLVIYPPKAFCSFSLLLLSLYLFTYLLICQRYLPFYPFTYFTCFPYFPIYQRYLLIHMGFFKLNFLFIPSLLFTSPSRPSTV